MSILNLVEIIREHIDPRALKDALRRELLYEWSVAYFFDDKGRVERGLPQLPRMVARAANIIVACGRHRMCFLGRIVELDFEYGPPLVARMKRERCSIVDLAEKTSLSESTIQRVRSHFRPDGLETSRRYRCPKFDTVIKIGRAFDGIDFIYDSDWYWKLVSGATVTPSPLSPTTLKGAARVAKVLRRLLEDRESRARVSAEFEVPPAQLDAWVANVAPELESLVRLAAERDRALLKLIAG